jgi:DNA-binding Xre family transcriptional regulator
VTELTLTGVELLGVITFAVALAATDAAAISRLFVAALAKKLSVKPGEILRYDDATDGGGSE